MIERSFMSEHSVELNMIPYLITILSRKYRRIIPFYFWATREGNKLSQSCDNNTKMRIVAIFARPSKS